MRGGRRPAHTARMDWNHMHSWSAGVMTLWTVLWLGLLVAVAFVAVEWARGGHLAARAPSSRELLDRRLARGEIGVEEYRRLRAALGDSRE